MTRYIRILALLILMTAGCAASAQAQHREDREEWNREMREFKHEYFTKELKLTQDQQARFFPVYDTMSTERRDARRKVRHAQKELDKKGRAATEADYERVAKMQVDLKAKESDIEERYYPQLRAILTPKQLVDLKTVESSFTKLVRSYYHERKASKKK